MPTNNDRLRALRASYNLTNRDLCEMLGLPVSKQTGTNSRLAAWITTQPWQNPMPDQMLKLLKFEIEARQLRKTRAK